MIRGDKTGLSPPDWRVSVLNRGGIDLVMKSDIHKLRDIDRESILTALSLI